MLFCHGFQQIENVGIFFSLMEIICWHLLVLIMSRSLLAVFHIESLASQPNKAKVREALEKLPKGLDDTYHEALERIAHQGQPSIELANQVLYWISYAYRPLTVSELRCALAVTPGRPTFDEDAMTPESTLVSVCAGLVAVDSQSGIVRLVHYTTQEFFEKIRDNRFPTARADITLTCLTYLSFDHPSSFKHWKETPFLEYAARYWRDHMRASPETDVNELILPILSQPRKIRLIFGFMHKPILLQWRFEHVIQDPNLPPLCAAAIFGLESVVVLLLERGSDLTRSVMSDGKTALNAAACFTQQEVMKILLDHGASLESHDRQGCTPLLAMVSAVVWANEKRTVTAARLLLDQGANVNIQGETFGNRRKSSSLMEAASFGSLQLVELLLMYGADPNQRDDAGQTALHLAQYGPPRISQLLVKHGADINACDKWGCSTLLRASHCPTEDAGDKERMLLELGADVHSRNNVGETALFKAAERGCCRVIQVLLEHGADIYARDKCGRSVLFSAISCNYGPPDELVSLLLDHGADLDSQNSAGDTALGRAAAKGLPGTVKLFLKHKPHIDSSNGAGDTALTLAAAAEATLDGSNPRDKSGKCIDQAIRMAAAVEAKLITMELLLNDGASVDLKNKAGNAALTLVVATEKLNGVRVLLPHMGHIGTRNGAGDTALILVAAKGKLDAVKLLLEHRANIDTRNGDGDTALTLAAANGKLETVKLLLNHGANVHAMNEAGDTALSLATQDGHSEVHQLLLERLFEPNQPPVGTAGE